MFSGKQIQRMSTGRKNVFIIRPENGAEWRNAALKPAGQRSSPFVVDGRFGNLWIWGNAAAWAPAWRQRSSSVQNIQICMKLREDSAYLWRMYECDSDVHVSVYLLSFILVRLTEGEEQVMTRGRKKLGPLWEQRGGMWMWMHEGDPR